MEAVLQRNMSGNQRRSDSGHLILKSTQMPAHSDRYREGFFSFFLFF
jgi:hypothetical protein